MKSTLFSIIIIIIISSLTSCNKTEDLNGTWIGAYYTDDGAAHRNTISGIEFNEIWTFENGDLHIKDFKYDMAWPRDNHFKIALDGNELIFDNKKSASTKFVIKPLNKDSLVLKTSYSGYSEGFQEKVYKKLSDSLKNKSEKFELTGKTYLRRFKTWTDTIQFVNDSIFVSHAWRKESNLYWERVHIDGFDILFTDIYPPFILKKKVGNKIYVSTFDRHKEDWILEEIEYDKVLQYGY